VRVVATSLVSVLAAVGCAVGQEGAAPPTEADLPELPSGAVIAAGKGFPRSGMAFGRSYAARTWVVTWTDGDQEELRDLAVEGAASVGYVAVEKWQSDCWFARDDDSVWVESSSQLLRREIWICARNPEQQGYLDTRSRLQEHDQISMDEVSEDFVEITIYID